MNILEVQDLCKTYGTGETEVHALNHVSFSVRKGEFIPARCGLMDRTFFLCRRRN